MNILTLSPPLTPAEQANADRFECALRRLERNGREDPELRLFAPRPAVIEDLQRDELPAIEVFARACAAYAERPALGQRAFTLEPSPEGETPRYLPAWDTLSYGAAWRRTVELATGLARDPRTALRPGEIVGIVGFASIDYVIADLACLYAGVASAVLLASMDPSELKHIVNEGAFAGLFCAWEALPGLMAVLPDCPSVRGVVVMDLHPGATRETLRLRALRERAALPVLTLEEAAGEGRAAPPLAPWIPASGTDPLATLMYTSGSTGFPKGAMLTHSLWRTHWQLGSLSRFARFPSIGVNFYPLGHALGRTAVLRTLVLGGITHFTLNSDLSTLFEDIRLARPTFLNLVPRLSGMIHQACRGESRREAGAAPPAFLGDRLTAAVIGSAPTAPEIAEWLAWRFGIPVYEIYGSTEAGILSVDGVISRSTVSEYRVAEVPELGYRPGDRPYPRGELRVRTRQGIPGFFRNTEATRALYDGDGLLRTGDIVEERGPGQVAWIDRINNVVKLAQGEYVTLWRLESLFSGDSPLLDQVYLHADSRRAFLLAVVVPDWAEVAARLGEGPSPAAVKQLLRGEFGRIAGSARLRPWEVPRDFIVETGGWTRENGLLTGVNKPARPQLKRRYGERLEALYARCDEQERTAPEGDGGGAPRAVRVRQAIAAVLGVPDLDLASGSFRDLGGDSIGALALSLRLEEVCGGPVPAAAILNPGTTLEALVGQLEGRGEEPGGLPSFESVHGRDGLIRAEDLRLERLLGPSGFKDAAAVAAQSLGPVKTVLLTGASGFLGHVLCLEWLERMAQVGGRVCALIRAPDHGAAAARLRAAFEGAADLLQRFQSLAGGRLEVLAGDLAAPRLGLSAAAYASLAREVDLIVHAGALVNHVFSYEQLFEPNVRGTAQLLRLALEVRRKRFDYVSSVGVLAGAAGSGKVLERDGVDALRTAWPARGGYAHGYATTKWASEVLLRSAHERFSIPVRVFRPDLIMPDRRYPGQANVPDMLTRLLASVIHTGLAPRSFYRKGQSARAHFDGLPVDFIAASMAALSAAGGDGLATYQVSNDHWDDGVSLDTLIDWVATAGYKVQRMDDHAAWHSAFSAALQALPAGPRRHSALAILEPWALPLDGGEGERIDASRFSAEVRRLRPGAEGIPRLTESYLHKYLADLRALNVIPGIRTGRPRCCR